MHLPPLTSNLSQLYISLYVRGIILSNFSAAELKHCSMYGSLIAVTVKLSRKTAKKLPVGEMFGIRTGQKEGKI